MMKTLFSITLAILFVMMTISIPVHSQDDWRPSLKQEKATDLFGYCDLKDGNLAECARQWREERAKSIACETAKAPLDFTQRYRSCADMATSSETYRLCIQARSRAEYLPKKEIQKYR
jgi:hypothetical protein